MWCLLLSSLKQCVPFSKTAPLQEAVVVSCTCSHLLFPTERQKHLRPAETWLPGVSPVSRHQIIEGRGRRKYVEIKRDSQTLHCRLMLMTIAQGQEREKKDAQWSRCVEGATPGGVVSGQRGIIHPHKNAAELCSHFGPKGRCGCLVIGLRQT